MSYKRGAQVSFYERMPADFTARRQPFAETAARNGYAGTLMLPLTSASRFSGSWNGFEAAARSQRLIWIKAKSAPWAEPTGAVFIPRSRRYRRQQNQRNGVADQDERARQQSCIRPGDIRFAPVTIYPATGTRHTREMFLCRARTFRQSTAKGSNSGHISGVTGLYGFQLICGDSEGKKS